jgi:hypothetical protein
MGRAIGADQPGAVDGKAYRQALQRDVVDDLVVAALQEGRVDRAERTKARGRHAGGEGHRVLFGNADVEDAARKAFRHDVEAGAAGHRGGHRHQLGVAGRGLGQGLAEDAGIAGRVGAPLGLRAGRHVELRHAVIAALRRLGGGVALALDRAGMDQHRAGRLRTRRAQRGQQFGHGMAVDRAEVGEAQILEQRRAAGLAGQHGARAPGVIAQGWRQRGFEPRREVAQRQPRLRRAQLAQIAAHRADGRGDGHVVVVEDHEQPAPLGPRIVQRLVGHARGDRAVADDGDGVARGLAHVAPHGEAQRGRDRGGTVRRAERVVLALRPLGETRDAAALAQPVHAVPPPGQDLVRIALVADVPDQLVEGRAEDRVQRHGQFHHPQRRAQVPARAADRRDHLGAQFGRQRGQFGIVERAQVVRAGDAVEKRGGGHRLLLRKEKRCRGAGPHGTSFLLPTGKGTGRNWPDVRGGSVPNTVGGAVWRRPPRWRSLSPAGSRLRAVPG